MGCTCPLSCVFALIGAIVVLRVLLKFVCFVASRFRRPSSLSQYKDKDAENWAVVTGASMGIGKAFAEELAKRKYNLVLYSLGEDLLKQIAADFVAQYSIQVRTREINLVTATDEEWESVRAELAPLSIGVLVNNAGVTQLPGKLDQSQWSELDAMIMLNVRAATRLTHILIPKMIARKCKSAVINMSSFTSLVPSPMLQVYGATKAYMKHFSLSLADEYRGKLDVLSVAPWWVVTSMTKIKRASLTAITPSRLVRSALCHIGYVDHVDPYWVHALLDIGVQILPRSYVSNKFIKQQTFVRSRLLIHKQQESKTEDKQ